MSKPDIVYSIADYLVQDHVDLMCENMALKEVAEQALEVLEDVPYMSNKDDYARLEKTTALLRQALLTKEKNMEQLELDFDDKYVSDGSTASYYILPNGAAELQDLISYKDMNAQIGEIFRACYRYGECKHSDKLRDAKKILFYAQAEVQRLERGGA